MAKKWAATLSGAQFAEARKFEAAGLTSISQAVKAFERGDKDAIATWRKALAEKAEHANDA